ncbi:MAG: DUF1214 domain-containing protein [Myxococcota bacterium]
MSDARKALHELIDLLREVDQRYLSSEWNLTNDADVAEGARAVMHMLQGGLVSHFEDDPDHPTFRKIVSPTRKFTGDNPDAIYFEAPVRHGLVYRVRGNMAGAVYVSITVETGPRDGTLGTGTNGVINDTMFDVGADGSFEITLGGPEAPRNWLALPSDANRITTRHYFEEETPAAADDLRAVPLRIDVLSGDRKAVETPNDASIAAGIRRVAGFVRARTLGMPPMANREQPAFVSKTPNVFAPPVKPGQLGLAAFDAAYSLAPYVIGPDQALVITGRWPKCRSGYVCLWTRHQMTYDYVNRPIGLNRKQTKLESDGSFRIVLAHRDPGVPNWLDSEGRPFGLVFWRYFLPEGEIVTPQAEIVPFAEVATR